MLKALRPSTSFVEGDFKKNAEIHFYSSVTYTGAILNRHGYDAAVARLQGHGAYIVVSPEYLRMPKFNDLLEVSCGFPDLISCHSMIVRFLSCSLLISL